MDFPKLLFGVILMTDTEISITSRASGVGRSWFSGYVGHKPIRISSRLEPFPIAKLAEIDGHSEVHSIVHPGASHLPTPNQRHQPEDHFHQFPADMRGWLYRNSHLYRLRDPSMKLFVPQCGQFDAD